MAQLDVSTYSGHLKTVDLDKRQAISIGAHPSNDIQVEGDDVEIMHARISWNKQGFEVVAAGGDGVDVNGTLVMKAVLEPGDVMRIGAADIRYLDDGATAPAEAEQDGDLSAFSLVPLSGEIEVPLPPMKEAPPDDAPLTAEELVLDDVLEEIEADVEEKRRSKSKKDHSRSADRQTDDRAKAEARRQRKRERAEQREKADKEERSRRKSKRSKPEADDDPLDEFDALDEQADEKKSSPDREKRRVKDESPADAADKALDEKTDETTLPKVGLRHRLRTRPQRPGDRDAVRSPLVLMLGGGAALLTLIGLTFFFIINRQTTQARFDEAQALMDEGKYSQAIKAFDQFIALFPRDPLVDQANVQMGISKIERHIGGASPNWPEGLKELNAFINARVDQPDFEELRDGIRRRAEQIAEGAAVSAGKQYDRELLTVSDDARNLLTRYSPEDAPPDDAIKRIQAQWRTSEAAILKHETLTKALAAIDADIADKRPLDALIERQELLRRYADFETDKRLVAKLDEILQTELELTALDDEPIAAVTDDHPIDVPPPLTLTFHARSRTDEVSVGQTIYGIAKDACYAVDSITGEPVWRRVIGRDAPFFPVPVDAGVPSLLVFSTRYDELQLVNQRDGTLIWRQPGVKGVTGPPTVDEGQLYVLSSPGTLNKIDLASGQVTTRLTFSQPVVAPAAALLDGKRLVVAGSQEVVYTLSKRPLKCLAVSYFGHRPESIVAPLLPMGALVLMCENQPGETSLLRVLDTRQGDKLVQVAEASVAGHVIDPPVIRGRDVFVPSTGERVSSFSASDEPGQTPLTVGPRYEPEGAEQSPMFLATGPDRVVWMASRYLRQLQLTTDAIQPGSKVVNIGIATQPIQLLGHKLYIGRSQPFSTATTLFQTDRDDLTSDWQTVVGARLLGWGSYPQQDGLVAVNESGDVFRISDGELAGGGFLSTTTVRLNLPDGLEEPLGARQLADGRIAVWCGTPQPQLWLVNRVGQTDRPHPLPGPLECPPVLLGDRVVVPIAGKLHLLRTQGGQSQVQDYSLPQTADGTSRWKQVIGVNESTVIAATDAGSLIQIRLQTSPQAFLAEAGRIELGAPLAFRLGADQGMAAVATDKRLQLLDAATLEPRAEVELPAPVSNDVWVVGDAVFVETGRQDLHIYSTADGLAQQKSIPLEGVPCAGAPLVLGATAAVALQDGHVLLIDRDTGEITGQKNVGEDLSEGPKLIGENIVTATVDGSLVHIGSTNPGNPGGN